MKRKWTALLLALLLALSAGGCGDPSAAGAGQPPAGTEARPAPTPTPLLPTPAPTPEPEPPTVVTLAVCGDVMSHMPVTNDAYDAETGAYSYTRIMSGAAALVAGADYAVANLETTLAGGPDYSGYPAFHSPDALARDLRDMGFDLLLTANNHCMDKGFSGLRRTLDVLDGLGMAHVGTSRTREEADDGIVVADVGGISVAFLGYTYGTNGIPLPGDAPFAVNLFNTDYMTTLSTLDEARLLADLDKAKALDADLIAVLIHWGIEYKTRQNAYQEQVADFLIRNGADLVLGGHPHVLEPMELRTVTDEAGNARTGFVCWSLGNFISSQVYSLTDTTVVLTLELTKDNATGEAGVSGWTYAPMLMVNRGEGAAERFELTDAYAALEAGPESESLGRKLQGAIDACHEILGPEHDPRAARTDPE